MDKPRDRRGQMHVKNIGTHAHLHMYRYAYTKQIYTHTHKLKSVCIRTRPVIG